MAIGVDARGAFLAQGMSLKDDACIKFAAKVGGLLGMDNMEELAEEYEVFHINRGETDNVVTTHLLEAFKDQMQRQRSQSSTKKKGKAWHSYTSVDLDDVSVSLDKSFSRVQAVRRPKAATPAAKDAEIAAPGSVERPKRPAEVPELQPKKRSAFSQRQNGGSNFTSPLVVRSHDKGAAAGQRSGEREGRAAAYSRVVDEDHGFSALVKGPGAHVKYMYDTQDRMTKLVDERIQKMVDVLEQDYGIEASNSVYSIANQPVVVCGRICCDSAEGRLNEASILIEGSHADSQGMRVRLDTSKLGSVTLFPGQVVAVEGINPSGHCITAFAILTGVPRAPHCPTAQGEGGRRKVSVACGPFTTTEDLSLEPLKALIESAGKDKCDLLVLCGPFVDKDHPIVRQGKVDMEYDDIFGVCCEALRALPEETKVVMVPSVRDVHHDPLFPQPAFRTKAMPGDVREKLICVSNPSVISSRGLTIGVTSHDVLKHLSGAEMHRSQVPDNRMSRLAAHLLRQGVFYPLLPPAKGTCLDSKVAMETTAMFLPVTPDVLVVPSDLVPFAKEVPIRAGVYAKEDQEDASLLYQKVGKCEAMGSCVCVNPGRLAKGTTGGTFCTIDVGEKGDLEKATVRKI